ncbi:MAG: site-specific DNA-methyltransferase [Palaeococcus sp.]|uniref:DNA-methyltransferase n=1 Tax=Palaeococcus sp. (in: euryarchaeotes) TaxID=2820298 RepID=UPI0025DEC285|nr:site-specific DNA-methyltransferase [Palaeococcus sp. (in: euryarchaeotes)]MCD6559325.1 site-specific DNA-methyltransferase [Palaeococcus sp. (in: euryarchaeotes)]
MIIDEIILGDCLEWIPKLKGIHLSFLDPPFNQGKEYRFFNDKLSDEEYWGWMEEVVYEIYKITEDGGAIYFMQREKNTEWVLKILREAGWTLQNLIIWKKMASAVPQKYRFNKAYQIIAFATKGKKPRVFNKLRADYPLAPWHKYPRENGMYIHDVWEDIRELTSGYFAGDEPIRDKSGKRLHLQQSPVALLLRIILSSTMPGDVVLDPFAGTGTTLVVAKQLKRHYIGIEIDPRYVEIIKNRLSKLRKADDVGRYREYYRFTEDLDKIWPVHEKPLKAPKQKTLLGVELSQHSGNIHEDGGTAGVRENQST